MKKEIHESFISSISNILRKSRVLFKDSISKTSIRKIHKNYPRIIKKLQKEIAERKIRVAFLNCDSSKWAYQSIYEKFNSDSNFETFVLVTVNKLLKQKKYTYLDWKSVTRNNYNFFKEKGINVFYAYDFEKDKDINLKEFKPDIVFYDEPLPRIKNQTVKEISKYALPLYCTYGSCISNGENEYPIFGKEVFAYFVDNPYIKTKLLERGFKENNVIVAGQPKLDEYLKPINEQNIIWKTNKKRIIYAPHFSFFSSSTLRYGTFDWVYSFIYEYAKNHPEYEFIIKPHPVLKRQIVHQNLMSVSEMEQYFKNWAELENAQLMETGAYIDMFRTSDLLITDCNSFLYEYLPTLKPVIHLINAQSVGHNEFGQKIISGYYPANNLEELTDYIDSILCKNEDNLLSVREDILKNYIPKHEGGVSSFVLNFTKQLLSKEMAA